MGDTNRNGPDESRVGAAETTLDGDRVDTPPIEEFLEENQTADEL
ncbi:hypothetical protein RYH80_04065 [Halobaculum sp. MBLA0147]